MITDPWLFAAAIPAMTILGMARTSWRRRPRAREADKCSSAIAATPGTVFDGGECTDCEMTDGPLEF